MTRLLAWARPLAVKIDAFRRGAGAAGRTGRLGVALLAAGSGMLGPDVDAVTRTGAGGNGLRATGGEVPEVAGRGTGAGRDGEVATVTGGGRGGAADGDASFGIRQALPHEGQ